MNRGKFLRWIVGTVAFFNSLYLMKSTQFYHIGVLFLIVLIFSCSSTKHLNSKNTVVNDFESELHIDRNHTKNPFFVASEKEEKIT